MKGFYCSTISILLLLLSSMNIDATKHRFVRQTGNECPYPDVPICDYVQCANGRCVEDKNSLDCYKCQCAPGFVGKLCDTPLVIPGACNPGCQNGGVCSQTPANTTACVCPPEYTGSLCETSVLATHPCVANPAATCQNGGTCNINGADYVCNCTVGWTGRNCETVDTLTSCNSNPCGAHGTCISGVSQNGPTVFCNCENRWTGRFCDVDLDSLCPAGYCLSGGTCELNGNTIYCVCPPTHTGPRCETAVGIITPTTTTTTTSSFTPTTTTTSVLGSCSNGPCLNGGSCFQTGNGFFCFCTQQWSGPTCNTPTSVTPPITTTTPNPNACVPNPCLNGGSCFRHNNSFVCACTLQYTGPTCALVRTTTPSPSACTSQPCKNGGLCYNTGNSYFCYCGANGAFTGKNCETSIASPGSNCPLNCGSGTCVNAGATGQSLYACLCNGTLTPQTCSP